MQSLLFVSSIVALLAVAAAIKCQYEQHLEHTKSEERKPINCPNATFCTFFYGINFKRNMSASVRRCDDPGNALCTEVGARDHNHSMLLFSIPGTLWCCVGDLCNSFPKLPETTPCPKNPATAPTALLSMAILAVVRAALN